MITEIINKSLQESATIEIKKAKNSFPKDALKTYSAFANTEGGILILGLEETDNQGVKTYGPCGLVKTDKIIKEMFDLLNDPKSVNKNILSDTNIRVDNINSENFIIIVEIPRATYMDKPIYLNENPYTGTYKRTSSGDYRCSKEEVDSMIRDATPQAQDRTVIDDWNYALALDQVTIQKYRNVFRQRSDVHPFLSMNDRDFLAKIGAITIKNGDYYPTLAGLLVFGKTEFITQVLPAFILEYINYGDKGTERWNDRLIYDGTWGEGNIFNFYYATINKLKNTLLNKFALDKDNITRIDTSELEVAFREALANCLIHSDYRSNNRIKISYRNNQYFFFNPGTLRVSKSEFFAGVSSQPRNPTIASILRLIGVVEEAGSGVPKILQALKTNKLVAPELITRNDTVELVISIYPEIEYLAIKFELSPEEVAVVSVINDHYSLSRPEIESLTNMSKKKALNIINSLKERDIIEQIGRASATQYRISRVHLSDNQATINMLRHLISVLQK